MLTSGLIPRRVVATRPDRSARVALAVARRRLLGAHLTFVLELMERARGSLSAPDALRVYARLHALSDSDLEWLANEILVYVGHGREEDIAELHRRSDTLRARATEWDASRTIAQQIRRRIRGRRNHRLRSLLDLHAGRVECEILRLHVENLYALSQVMDPLTSRADLVRTYMHALGVRTELWSILNWGLLDRLYEHTDGDPDKLEPAPDREPHDASAPSLTGRISTRLSTV